MPRGPVPRPWWERAEAKIDREAPGGCWAWTGGTCYGYGIIGIGPHKTGQVHRLMYERVKGPIPLGLTLDHLCRNRACCNPDHLELVTRGENVLRGESTPARNARKTHCKNGHDLRTSANVYPVRGGTGRQCRVCRLEYMRGYGHPARLLGVSR